MNSLVVSLAIMAVLAYTAGATPCTEICNGQCALAKQACDLPGIFGDLCDTSYAICGLACGAACNCVDTCAQQCGGEFAECRGDGFNPLNVAACGLNLSVCGAACTTQCGFTTLAGIVNSLASPSGGPGSMIEPR